ncbi:MAG: CaiB/BaiF CoA-transferase family protein [Bacillota bacterium]|nr:CaiB/BaiF CoA-transferase family protein [Bacillota bacterium]MDW7682897.1 CaiB/BaiF CoA-transferase family protein [Bacillota bacterium]
MKLLSDVRVLDLTRLYPGPFCTMMMADMGAEVIKIESPGEGDYMRDMGPAPEGGDSLYFKLLNRNKKSMTLNLKAKGAAQVFLRLAAEADVIVEGFRPGVVDSLGVGYKDVCQVNPDIVYCSITGYGQEGPCSKRAGHDLNYIALAGILGITGNAGSAPAIPGVQIGDVGGGALMGLSAVLAALYARERGQGGRYLDIAMLDGLVSWLPLAMAEVFAGNSVVRGGAALNGGLACYHVYETADAKHMTLAALEQKFWQAFCQAVTRDDLCELQYQPDQAALKKELAKIFKSRTRSEWEETFANVDACCEPVLDLVEVGRHPQVRARGMVSGNSLGCPIRIQGEEMAVTDAPALGCHTVEVLSENGFSETEIATLREKGIV